MLHCFMVYIFSKNIPQLQNYDKRRTHVTDEEHRQDEYKQEVILQIIYVFILRCHYYVFVLTFLFLRLYSIVALKNFSPAGLFISLP